MTNDQVQAYENISFSIRRSQELWQRFSGMIQAMDILLRSIADNSENLSNNLKAAQSQCGTQLLDLRATAMNQALLPDGSSLSPTKDTTQQLIKKPPSGSKRPVGRPRASTSKPSTRKAAKAVRTKGKLPRRSSSGDVLMFNQRHGRKRNQRP